MPKIQIQIDNEDKNGAAVDVEVWAQKLGDKLWFHHAGQTFCVEFAKKSARRKQNQTDDHSSVLLAPMPGKVTKILKKEGEKIEAGEAVLVMEAMKMEYTLKFSIGGKLKKLSAKVLDQVLLGQTLAELEP